MVWIHLHRHSTHSGVPGGVSYETLFTTHQTFAKLVTQIFLSTIKLQKHNFLVTIISTSYWKPYEWFQKIQTYVSSSKYPYIYLSHFEDRQNPLLAITFLGLHTSKCMITNKFVARSLWPMNGISITSLFRGKFQVSDDSKSNDFKIHHNGIFPCGFLQCDQMQCHTCVVFFLVLRHLASMLRMYHITINIHNIRSIDDGSMALMLFIILNYNCSFMNNTLTTNIMQMG